MTITDSSINVCSGLTGKRSRSVLAVLIEGAASLFDPCRSRSCFDYALGSRPMPVWISRFIQGTFGEGKLAIIYFAAITTVVVAVVGAIASYTENYLTTKIGQMVMLDLRQMLYHHIQRPVASRFTTGPKSAT